MTAEKSLFLVHVFVFPYPNTITTTTAQLNRYQRNRGECATVNQSKNLSSHKNGNHILQRNNEQDRLQKRSSAGKYAFTSISGKFSSKNHGVSLKFATFARYPEKQAP